MVWHVCVAAAFVMQQGRVHGVSVAHAVWPGGLMAQHAAQMVCGLELYSPCGMWLGVLQLLGTQNLDSPDLEIVLK